MPRLGQKLSPEAIGRMTAAQRIRRFREHLRHRDAEALRVGDMVVCPPANAVGLLVELNVTSPCKVMFCDGWLPLGYSWRGLRRATKQEILDAGLAGVGCNQTLE